MSLRLVPVVFACLLVAVGAGCSSDSDGSPPDFSDVVVDAGASDVAPTDDAERVDVEVPQINRRFRMSLAAPTDGAGTAWYDNAWSRATTQGDVLTIWLDRGLPWVELLDGDGTIPASLATELTLWRERADQAGLIVMLVVDGLNDDRTGFRGDIYGRDVPQIAGATFAEGTVAQAYADFCITLLDSIEPTFFVPIVEHNRYGFENRGDYEALQQWYSDLFEEATLGRAVNIFPIWDFIQLRNFVESGDELARQVRRRFDEEQGVFAVSLYPARDGVRLADLDAADFQLIDQDSDTVAPVTSKNAAFIGVGFPAEGFTVDGVAYPSSENSQFNFLAFLLGLESELTLELVVWRVAVDPDAWLAAPCGDTPEERCDVDGINERWVPLRSNGLYDRNNGARPAGELWEDYASRTQSTGP